MSRPGETHEQQAHRHDREAAAAHWHRRKAQRGEGPKFELPPSLRKAKR